MLSLPPKHYNLIDLQLKSFNCVPGPLGAIFMTGMLLRHVGQTAVIIAGITGAISRLMLVFMDVIFSPLAQAISGNTKLTVFCPTPFMVIPLFWLVTFLLSALLGEYFDGPTLDQVRRFTWRGAFYPQNDRV